MEYRDKASSAQLNNYLKSILDYLCNVLLCVHRQLVVKGAHLAGGNAGSSIIIACERPHVGELFGLVWKRRVIDDVPVEHIELVHLHQVQVGLQHRLCNVVSEGVSNSGEYFFLYIRCQAPACVKEDSTMCKTWRVEDLSAVHNKLEECVPFFLQQNLIKTTGQ